MVGASIYLSTALMGDSLTPLHCDPSVLRCTAPISYFFTSFAAVQKTPVNMASVSFPVFVFWFEG